MKKVRINMALIAAILGLSTAVAFKPAPKSTLDSTWTRTINSNNQVSWVSGTVMGNCLESSEICRATFPTGYDPSQHDDSTNKDEASSYTEGFVQVQ